MLARTERCLTEIQGEECRAYNMLLAQIMSTSGGVVDWRRLNLLRMYLIRAYRARCQALGKPAHGQRTWSNAWTAFKYNTELRRMLAQRRRPIPAKRRRRRIRTRKSAQAARRPSKKKHIRLWL